MGSNPATPILSKCPADAANASAGRFFEYYIPYRSMYLLGCDELVVCNQRMYLWSI
uniref:Uncharacterized protein n=1 Tax=Paenibacillus polymyxa TaxID=1406 RepID=A0AAE9PYU5_PAEPO